MTTPIFKVLCHFEIGLAKSYLYTKFEIFSFTRSRFAEGGLKFNFWSLDPDHHS